MEIDRGGRYGIVGGDMGEIWASRRRRKGGGEGGERSESTGRGTINTESTAKRIVTRYMYTQKNCWSSQQKQYDKLTKKGNDQSSVGYSGERDNLTPHKIEKGQR